MYTIPEAFCPALLVLDEKSRELARDKPLPVAPSVPPDVPPDAVVWIVPSGKITPVRPKMVGGVVPLPIPRPLACNPVERLARVIT
jgi:hypothetical protein